MPVSRHPVRPLCRRLAVAWWLGLLLAAQWLALTHGVVHGVAHGHSGAHEVPAALSAADHPALFDDHEAGSEHCRLIDGAAQALSAPCGPVAVALPAPAGAPAPATAVPLRAAGHRGLPQARAPPLA